MMNIMSGSNSWPYNQVKLSKELLESLREEGKISDTFFAEAVSWAEDLANQIMFANIASKPLLETDDIKSLDELLIQEKKAVSEIGIFHQMEDIVKEHAKRIRIQKKAVDEILNGRDWAHMPALKVDAFIPIDLLYDMQSFMGIFNPIVWKKPDASGYRLFITDDNVALIFIDDCILACGSLYQYVSGVRKVPDPPDDWFKTPHQTMLNGGDCDDLAILYCSLARSVGFHIYLAFQPRHVYPGVFIRESIEIKKEDLPSEVRNEGRVIKATQVYEVVEKLFPVDSTIPMPSLVLNVQGKTRIFPYLGRYTVVFKSLYSSLSEHEKKKIDAKIQEIDEGLKTMMDPDPNIYFID